MQTVSFEQAAAGFWRPLGPGETGQAGRVHCSSAAEGALGLPLDGKDKACVCGTGRKVKCGKCVCVM